MEFWIVGTIHCKESTLFSLSYSKPYHVPTHTTYLLDQPHLKLGEKELREEEQPSET